MKNYTKLECEILADMVKTAPARHTPWKLINKGDGYLHITDSIGDYVIADWDIQSDSSVGIRCDANKEIERFELIVRAVNSHSALLEAAKELREVVAACFRVFTVNKGTTRAFENEFAKLGIKDGFGVRAQDAIKQAEGK